MAIGLKIINGDFIIHPSGWVEIVEQSQKCSRDFGKMLVTDREFAGNESSFYRYNPFYGTELNNRALYHGLSRMSIREVVITKLNEAINDYLRLQELRSNLDYGEIITSVDFDVFYDVEEARNLIIDIRFQTAESNEIISLGQFVQSIV